MEWLMIELGIVISEPVAATGFLCSGAQRMQPLKPRSSYYNFTVRTKPTYTCYTALHSAAKLAHGSLEGSSRLISQLLNISFLPVRPFVSDNKPYYICSMLPIIVTTIYSALHAYSYEKWQKQPFSSPLMWTLSNPGSQSHSNSGWMPLCGSTSS